MHVSRVPGKRVRREQDGKLTIDLWLCRDGAFDADLPLRLTPAEAEVLHAQLCYALDDESTPAIDSGYALPDCRRPVVGGGRGHRP
ncbi:hypothetical protein CGZ69_19210 [Streptomyces peucetius subsp. caesius ATCC 27952]|nr:hypothetical protein CGZ69_19210 [Streptomyces peucetius subsp. caesius ATCC 27952]